MQHHRKPKLPNFKSDRAERKFWSQHSLEEFSDELEDLDIQIRPARTEQIALRLYKDDLERLKKLAKRRGVGHTTLARSIVEQWLVAKRGTAKGRVLPESSSAPSASNRRRKLAARQPR